MSWWRDFLRGVGSAFDLFGPPSIMPMTDEDARAHDLEMLKRDWEAVGGDVQRAMDQQGDDQ